MAAYNANPQEQASPGGPDLNDLKRRYDRAISERGSSVFARARLNHDTRFCRWANQSDDGRKWKTTANRRIFPFPGASDARVPLVDNYILEDAAVLAVASARVRVRVNSEEPGDPQLGHRLTKVLHWLKNEGMPEYRRERRLGANKLLERGKIVVGVFWERREQLAWKEFDLESLKVDAMQADPNSLQAQMPTLVQDPTMQADALAAATELFPGVRVGTLTKALKELREQGHTRIPVPTVLRDAPCVVVLVPNEDLFISPCATSLQDAPDLHRPELLTETQLQERVRTHGWKKKWVDRVIATQRGNIPTNTVPTPASTQPVSHKAELYQVVHTFARQYDADGVPAIYYTVWHALVSDDHGWHGMLDYDHGQYPFNFIERESIDRDLDSARGYGEIAYPLQVALKTQIDARADRASMSTMPPSFHPPGEAPDAWGPGVQIPTSAPDRYGFMEIPKYDVGSKEIEASIHSLADRYFGRLVGDGENKVYAAIIQQEMVNNWLAGWQEVDQQILKLMQQFAPDVFFANPTGGDMMQVNRDDLQGRFRVHARFNTTFLDREAVGELINLFKEIVMMDAGAILDRNEMMEAIFEMVDPDLGERLLKPADAVRGQEIEDEKTVFAKLLSGVDEDVKPDGQAHQLRLQVFMQLLQTNPTAQRIAAQDPHVQQLLEKRAKQLQFQLTEQQNAKIGALGA